MTWWQWALVGWVVGSFPVGVWAGRWLKRIGEMYEAPR